MSDETPEYEVGYRRPPKHSRFQPGTSGNPRGRPRGKANLLTDIVKELAEQIRIREGEHERSVTKQRAMVKALVAKSLKGESRAAALLINLLIKLSQENVGDTAPAQAATADDRTVIEAFLKRSIGKAGRFGGDDGL
jgi:hypothetical protein